MSRALNSCVVRGVLVCRHYRKRVICALPELNFLDDAAVTDKDRRLAAAFIRVSEGARSDLIYGGDPQHVCMCVLVMVVVVVERSLLCSKTHAASVHVGTLRVGRMWRC